jgi:hypothetical protein
MRTDIKELIVAFRNFSKAFKTAMKEELMRNSQVKSIFSLRSTPRILCGKITRLVHVVKRVVSVSTLFVIGDCIDHGMFHDTDSGYGDLPC